MPPSSNNRLPTLIFWVEIFFWLIVTYLGRAYFDRVAVSISPNWLAWVIRLLLLALIIGMAIFIHEQIERFLKSRGLIE